MDLISEYVAVVQEIDDIQEAGLDKKKVKRNNKLADRLRTIASNIDSSYPEAKPTFYQLLFHEKATVRIWTAHHILEVMKYDNQCRGNALREISYVAAHDDSIHGFGNKRWLELWFEEHPTDRELL